MTNILIQIEDIKDSIDYYVESNDEPDFQEDETLYDELGLEGLNIDLVSPDTNDDDDDDYGSFDEGTGSDDDDDYQNDSSQDDEDDDDDNGTDLSKHQINFNDGYNNNPQRSGLNTTQVIYPDQSPLDLERKPQLESIRHSMEPRILFADHPERQMRSVDPSQMDKFAQDKMSGKRGSTTTTYQNMNEMIHKGENFYRTQHNMMGQNPISQQNQTNPLSQMQQAMQKQSMSMKQHGQNPQLQMSQGSQLQHSQGSQLQHSQGSQLQHSQGSQLQHSQGSQLQHSQGLNHDHLASSTGVKKSSVEQSLASTLLALNASFIHLSETGNRKYQPMNPHKTPDFFPQDPLPIFDKPAVFEKFDIDTLFFIFYHQQNTKQQYFASRELKKNSWRYHTKYLTWFRRHDEPKIIEKDYEEGTYIYFDYELDNGWCQRKKCEFKFEYRFLEGQGS